MTDAQAVATTTKKRRPKRPTSEPTARRPLPNRHTALRFSPYAWAKLVYLRDYGDTEVGGFGITSADDLAVVEDIRLVRQLCTPVSVEFDDAAVADFFDEQVDLGRRPEQAARIWLHSHPGSSAKPSVTDEETFQRCFGRTDWSVMCILARGGQAYARLRFNVGPGGSWEIPVEVDFRRPFPAAETAAWEREYLETVQAVDGLLGGCTESGLDWRDVELLVDEEEEEIDDFQDPWGEYIAEDKQPLTRKEDP